MGFGKTKSATITTKFANGERLHCTITGYRGVVTAINIWANGCVRYALQAPAYVKDGETLVPAAVWVDEEQLEKVETVAPAPSRKHGGDRSAPSARPSDPTR